MPTSCTDVSHSAALAQRQDHADTSIRVGSFNIGMDQNTFTKREMDEMEAFSHARLMVLFGRARSPTLCYTLFY